MDRQVIIEKITPIVRNVFDNSSLQLSEDMSAQNTEEWTSLSFMQLLTQLENEFNFKFKIMELVKIKTLGDLINVLTLHLK